MKPQSPTRKGLALQGMHGFSMVEVLMALLIITFGLLGIAGMQAVSVGNTSTAGYRSIAALQAETMASAMSANPVYWQNATAAVPSTTKVSVSGTTITATATGGLSTYDYSTTATLNASTNYSTTCQTSVCGTPVAMAQYDVITWGQTLYNNLPGGAGTINCTAATSTVLVSCQIIITWAEKVLSQNQAVATGASSASYDFEMAVIP